jgi:hypothetical protein
LHTACMMEDVEDLRKNEWKNNYDLAWRIARAVKVENLRAVHSTEESNRELEKKSPISYFI